MRREDSGRGQIGSQGTVPVRFPEVNPRELRENFRRPIFFAKTAD